MFWLTNCTASGPCQRPRNTGGLEAPQRKAQGSPFWEPNVVPEDTVPEGDPRPNSCRILHAPLQGQPAGRPTHLGLWGSQRPGEALRMLGIPLVVIRECTAHPNRPPSPKEDRELGAPCCR